MKEKEQEQGEGAKEGAAGGLRTKKGAPGDKVTRSKKRFSLKGSTFFLFIKGSASREGRAGVEQCTQF